MNLANQLTVIRLILVPVFFLCLYYINSYKPYMMQVALLVFAGACITDALDGFIARKFKQRTVLGSYIDPIADKALLNCAYISLCLLPNIPAQSRIPAWLTICVVSRDGLILIGSALIHLTKNSLTPEPLIIGKITTFLQMSCVLVALMPIWSSIKISFFIVTLIFTLMSTISYLRMGSRLLR